MAELAYLAAGIPAVLIAGISKGAFGGGVGIVAVPVLALAVPPAQAAAILLPVLIAQDAIGLRAYWRAWDAASLRLMLPGLVAGVVLGGLAFGYLSADRVRLLIGLIAIGFCLHRWLGGSAAAVATPSRPRGMSWAAVGGFTSTLAHAGSPPVNVYLLPLGLEKVAYVGTMTVLFAVVNLVKIVPYALLGMFTPEVLWQASSLIPAAALGMVSGVWLQRRLDPLLFFRICYALVFLTGLKLLLDGASGLV